MCLCFRSFLSFNKRSHLPHERPIITSILQFCPILFFPKCAMLISYNNFPVFAPSFLFCHLDASLIGSHSFSLQLTALLPAHSPLFAFALRDLLHNLSVLRLHCTVGISTREIKTVQTTGSLPVSEDSGAPNLSGGPDTMFKQMQEPVGRQTWHGGVGGRRVLHRRTTATFKA